MTGRPPSREPRGQSRRGAPDLRPRRRVRTRDEGPCPRCTELPNPSLKARRGCTSGFSCERLVGITRRRCAVNGQPVGPREGSIPRVRTTHNEYEPFAFARQCDPSHARATWPIPRSRWPNSCRAHRRRSRVCAVTASTGRRRSIGGVRLSAQRTRGSRLEGSAPARTAGSARRRSDVRAASGQARCVLIEPGAEPNRGPA